MNLATLNNLKLEKAEWLPLIVVPEGPLTVVNDARPVGEESYRAIFELT